MFAENPGKNNGIKQTNHEIPIRLKFMQTMNDNYRYSMWPEKNKYYHMKQLYPVVSHRKSDLQTKKTGNYENTKIRLPEKSGSDSVQHQHGQILQNSEDQVLRSSANHYDHCYFIDVCRLQKSFRRKYCIICNTFGSVYNYPGDIRWSPAEHHCIRRTGKTADSSSVIALSERYGELACSSSLVRTIFKPGNRNNHFTILRLRWLKTIVKKKVSTWRKPWIILFLCIMPYLC